MFNPSSNMSMLGLGPAMNAVFAAAREKDESSRSTRTKFGPGSGVDPRRPRLAELRRRIASWCDHLAVNLFRAAIRLEPATGGSNRLAKGWLEG